MRSNFARNIKKIKIDIRKEYDKLYQIYTEEWNTDVLNREYSFEMIFYEHFNEYPFADTCLTLDEFNEECGYNFDENPQNFNIDYLINFCEYFYNLLVWLPHKFYERYDFYMYDNSFVMQHILKVIESVGYMQAKEDEFTIFVEKDAVVTTVASVLPEEMSYKIISYNHHSMRGDVEAKKAILLILANQLEPQEKKLSQIDATFKSELFFAFNNLNIRHNNTDPVDKRYYNMAVADMSEEELEHWYDETYQMCLLAFLRLEHIDRKNAISELKKKIEIKYDNQ